MENGATDYWLLPLKLRLLQAPWLGIAVSFLMHRVREMLTYLPVDGRGGELHASVVLGKDSTLVDHTAVLSIAAIKYHVCFTTHVQNINENFSKE